jgi:Mn2+/Fe2+ NRAMP family transporter
MLGLMMQFLGISPIKALVYTAVLYGLTAPVLISLILHICNNKKIMGKYTNKRTTNFLGIITLLLMTSAAAALLYLLFF